MAIVNILAPSIYLSIYPCRLFFISFLLLSSIRLFYDDCPLLIKDMFSLSLPLNTDRGSSGVPAVSHTVKWSVSVELQLRFFCRWLI